jgi:AraC-like DNA-binding protein
MSQVEPAILDPASHQGLDGRFDRHGTLLEVTTDGVPARERLSFWRDQVLRRLEPTKALVQGQPFGARVRRIMGPGAELLDCTSEAVHVVRTEARCRRDGCDDISIDLMVDCTSASIEHGDERRLRPGDLCIVDYTRPLQATVCSRHRAMGIILSRRVVQDAVGNDVSALTGRRVPTRGIGGLLRSHLLATFDEAPSLSPNQRLMALRAAADMALAALQAEAIGIADNEQFALGFYQAARALIDRDCGDIDLTPDRVARDLGCSRASLYRLFAVRGESVGAVIWATRLDHAQRLLSSRSHAHLLIAEIAFCCGFADQATFNRMFKRRYGITPRDAREVGP